MRKAAEIGLHFLSRLPDTFGITATLQQEAWRSSQWEEIGPLSSRKQAAQYRVQELPCEIDDQIYRAIVVFSTSLDVQKQKTLERKRARQQAELQAEVERLSRESFSCRDDAERAAKELAEAHERGFWGLTWSVDSEQHPAKRARPGRPKKGETPELVTCWKVQATMQFREERYAEAQRLAGTFVLISNDQRRTAKELLQAYKGQQNGVEIPFRVMKALPVTPVFLKSNERVSAFAWVVLMAYLVYSLMQYRVRTALREESDTLVTPGGLTSTTPTASPS